MLVLLFYYMIIIGQDYDLIQSNYVFTSDIGNVTVPVKIYDDNVAESLETFFVCLPNLVPTNADVMLINYVQPNCVRVNIIDDDSKTCNKNIC